jgi:hypothetical protein
MLSSLTHFPRILSEFLGRVIVVGVTFRSLGVIGPVANVARNLSQRSGFMLCSEDHRHAANLPVPLLIGVATEFLVAVLDNSKDRRSRVPSPPMLTKLIRSAHVRVDAAHPERQSRIRQVLPRSTARTPNHVSLGFGLPRCRNGASVTALQT